MPRYRATISLTLAYRGIVELDADDEEDLEERIAEEGYFEDKLRPQAAAAIIEDIECLDEAPGGGEDT
jgi:hypothetical protein